MLQRAFPRGGPLPLGALVFAALVLSACGDDAATDSGPPPADSGGDAARPDAAAPDAAVDSSRPDGGDDAGGDDAAVSDAGVDASVDGGADASTDAAGPDAGTFDCMGLRCVHGEEHCQITFAGVMAGGGGGTPSCEPLPTACRSGGATCACFMGLPGAACDCTRSADGDFTLTCFLP